MCYETAADDRWISFWVLSRIWIKRNCCCFHTKLAKRRSPFSSRTSTLVYQPCAANDGHWGPLWISPNVQSLNFIRDNASVSGTQTISNCKAAVLIHRSVRIWLTIKRCIMSFPLVPFRAATRSELKDPLLMLLLRGLSNKGSVSAQMYAKRGLSATMNISVPPQFRLHCVQKYKKAKCG